MTRADAAAKYQPTDRLYLWWLTRPQQPVLIAEISLVRSTQMRVGEQQADHIDRPFLKDQRAL